MASTDAVLLLSHGSRDPRAAHTVAGLVGAVAERTDCEVYATHLGFTGSSKAPSSGNTGSSAGRSSSF